MTTIENFSALVLPGMDGTGRLQTTFSSRLSANRTVRPISYPADVPGYEELSKFVADRLPDEKFVIVGESFSGPIAIEIAATEPRVAGLVLASSFANYPVPSVFAPLARLVDLSWTPDILISSLVLGSAGTRELKDRLHQVLATLPREVVRARIAEVLKVDKRDRLLEVTCPVMCLHGRFDRLAGKRHVKASLSGRPDCQFHWLDAPHMLLETHPGEAAEAVDLFCESLVGTDGSR